MLRAVSLKHKRARGPRTLCPSVRSAGGSLLAVLHFLELGVDDIAIVGLRAAAATTGRGFGTGATGLTGIGVHLLGQLVRRLRQRLRLRLDVVLVVALQRLFGILQGGLDRGLLGGVDLVDVLASFAQLNGSEVTEAAAFKDHIAAFGPVYGLCLQGLGRAPHCCPWSITPVGVTLW